MKASAAKTAPPKDRPQASSSPGRGKSSAEIVRAANRWRDNYNPLRGLVIAKVASLLEAAERGDFAELELTVKRIEKRYPVLKGLKTRRLSALEELDWDIKVKNPLPPGADEAMAEKQRDFLRSRYDLIENLTEAIAFLELAEFRGFSILQKHRIEGGADDGAVHELHWVPQWCFSREGQFGDFFYNKDSKFGIGLGSCAATLGETNRIGGEDFPREDFVIREVEDSLYEIALIAFVNWAMGRKDWSAFVEIFGLPKSIVIMPPNIPAGKEDEYRSAAESVSDGVAGALPNGSDAKFPTSSFRNNGPFKEFCDAQDADVVLAGTGGRLAMLTADKGGLGDGPSREHADAFQQIARAAARKVNQAFQRDFDKVELAAEFPQQPHCVYFELAANDEEDVKDLVANVATLKQAGKVVRTEFIAEKTGYEFDGDGAETTPSPVGDLDEGELGSAALRNREALPAAPLQAACTVQEMILPLLDRLQKIERAAAAGVDTDSVRLLVEKLLKDFPNIADVIRADRSLARQLAPALESALTSGLKNRIFNGGPGSGRYPAGSGGEAGGQIGALYDSALSGGGNEHQIIHWRPVDANEAAKLKTATGLDVAGYTHSLDAYAVRHIDAAHGNAARELPRGQLPVTKEDFKRIPEIIRTADKIEHAGNTKIGRAGIRYTKHYEGTTVVVEEVRTGRKQLVPVSIIKFKGRVENRATNDARTPFSTSETLRPDELITPNPEEVKP